MEASYTQTSFLAGEWSEWAQSRFDLPEYKKAMSKCLNAFPVDEGAVPRRPGFEFLGTSRNGAAGRLIPFDFTDALPYDMEFTDGHLRFWSETQLASTNDNQVVSSISGANPAVFTLPAAVTWATNDQATFSFSSPADAVTGVTLLNKQFILTMLTTTTFNATDAVTGVQVNGSGLTALTPTVAHISDFTTPYSVAGADWHSLRSVQSYDLAMLLHSSVAPQALLVLNAPTASSFASFEFTPASFQDGPYLDPPPNSIATISGTAGVVQVTVGYNAWASGTTYGIGVPVTNDGQDYISLANNNTGVTPGTNAKMWLPLGSGSMVSAKGFVDTDVGRMIRLFSEPIIWDPSTTFAAGDTVAYNGSYFTSLIDSNTNNEPDISTTDWVINTSAAIWTWGIITQVNSANSVSLQLQGANLLYTVPVQTWRLGVWSNTTGWPTCGCYQEGRFWFAGAVPNRVDSSAPNAAFNMSPTAQDGTVADSNAISYTLNASQTNPIFAMEPDHQGILMFTEEGEWLMSSGTAGAPMTPSNIQAHIETKYGSSNILPVRTGLTICFVQRQKKRLIEFLVDVFSQRFFGKDLSVFARHLGARGVEELAYQQQPAPFVWERCTDGTLTGTTYRRISLFSTQEPEFVGWHQHQLGSNRFIESICVSPSGGGTLDALSMVTNNLATNVRYVERMTPLMDETSPLTQAWFLDCAVTPPAASLSGNTVTFSGLWHLEGKKVSVFAAALDCGDFIVTGGQVAVTLGTADPLTGYTFDIPQFNLLQPMVDDFSDQSVTIVGSPTSYTIPCVIGFNYQSQGQLVRPQLPVDTGAKTGPGFGKKRRQARYAVALSKSLGVKIGVDNGKSRPVPAISPGGKQLPYLSTYSGIVRDTLENDFSFDSMLRWETTRPYPATVTALGGFITTEDV